MVVTMVACLVASMDDRSVALKGSMKDVRSVDSRVAWKAIWLVVSKVVPWVESMDVRTVERLVDWMAAWRVLKWVASMDDSVAGYSAARSVG